MSENTPSQTSINTSPTDRDILKYQTALSLKFYEGQIAWQINLLFVGLNIGLGTIIQNNLKYLGQFDGLLFYMSFIGTVINFYWYGTFSRNNKYYHFPMAQAREAEPKDFKFLNDRGYRFSKGEEVIIEGEDISDQDQKHKLNAVEKVASNKKAILMSIRAFFISSLLLLLIQSWHGIVILWGCICTCH